MTNEEAKKRLEVWLKCVYCPEEKKCYDSYLHSTCEYTDYCDAVSIEEAIKVAIKDLEQEPCEDAISRQAVLDVTWEEPSYTDALNVLTEVRDKVKALPPVNPQKPICPSAGIDCEDCPAYEDAISRKAVMEICNEEWDSDLIVERIGQLPSVSSSQKPKSEWQQDHEILKAYSDGASAVLDKVRDEIEKRKKNSGGEPNRDIAFNVCLQIIDSYAEEDKA